MTYVRTEDGIYKFVDFTKTTGIRCINHYGYTAKNGVNILGTLSDFKVYKKSDDIEELFDELVLVNEYRFKKPKTATELGKDFEEMKDFYNSKDDKIYGAIWTDEGLIYTAKMKGVLPNGETNWKLL